LLLVAALPGDDGGLDLERQRRADELLQEQEGFAALERKTARIKKMQDKTKVEIAQLRSDFGGPSSLAELPKVFAETQLKNEEQNSVVEAGLDRLERALNAQDKADEADRNRRAQAGAASLLETPHEWHLHHTKGFQLPEALVAQREDLLKTKALESQLHERAVAARRKFHADVERKLDDIQDKETAGEPDDDKLDSEAAEEIRDEDRVLGRSSLAELRRSEDPDTDATQRLLAVKAKQAKEKAAEEQQLLEEKAQRMAKKAAAAKAKQDKAAKAAKAAREKLEADKAKAAKEVPAAIAKVKHDAAVLKSEMGP